MASPRACHGGGLGVVTVVVRAIAMQIVDVLEIRTSDGVAMTGEVVGRVTAGNDERKPQIHG